MKFKKTVIHLPENQSCNKKFVSNPLGRRKRRAGWRQDLQ